MHITLMALGSRGDVQPYLTLGSALRRNGARVCAATFEGFAPLVAAAGLDLLPVPGRAEDLMATAGANMLKLVRAFGGLAEGYIRAFTAIRDLKTDAILCQLPGGLFGYDLAEALQVKLGLVAVLPLMPTRAFPALGFPALPLPGYNRLSYRLAEGMLWTMFRGVVNRWRVRTLGLRPSPFGGYFRDLERRAGLMLNGFSARLIPPPRDWGPKAHTTGYWFPPTEAWQPPPELERFIEAGPPPVFLGFGSMIVNDPAGTTARAVEAVRQAGLRAVLGAGWAGLGGPTLPDFIHRIGDAPYEWLFPRMAAIAHHGGSGTTHFAARSGRPSFVVPFVYDQFMWGRRLAELGAGPAPIPFARLSAVRLAAALAQAATDQAMRARAADLGADLRAEGGLAQAVALVEGWTQA